MKSSNKSVAGRDLVLVGRISGAHGIRGAMKIHSYAESTDLFTIGEPITLASPDGSTARRIVEWVKPHGRGLIMGLKGVTDRNLAEPLIGTTLHVDKSRLPPLEADTYYWSDLVGLRVIDIEGSELGRLDHVIPTAGNDVYVVKAVVDGRPQEVLIPAIGTVILSVDLDRQTMVVDLPEGL